MTDLQPASAPVPTFTPWLAMTDYWLNTWLLSVDAAQGLYGNAVSLMLPHKHHAHSQFTVPEPFNHVAEPRLFA